MKTNRIIKTPIAALTLLSSFILHPSSLFGQGSLSPPGPPAPTMKTLGQLEPRTPISSAPFTISAPGSYYLTTNLTVATGDAITIATNGVTLDLNGFTISSTAASAAGSGVLLSRAHNVAIFNGHIQGGVTNKTGTYNGPGFSSGIYYSGAAPVNTRVTDVAVSGCLNRGIYLSTEDSTIVESCTVRTVGGYGIAASTIKSSVAVECGNDAIYGDQVSGCRGECTGSGDGVYAAAALNCIGYTSGGTGLAAAVVQNCEGYSSGGGIGLYAGSTAQNCVGISSGGNGLIAERIAIGCFGYSSSGFGIYATIANSCIGETSSGTAQLVTHKYNMP